MRVRIGTNRRRNQARAEVFCRPLGWRAVARRVVYACLAAALSGGGAVWAALDAWHGSGPRTVIAFASFAGACAASILWLIHLINAARNPIMFKLANGELTVIKPFLFTRRRRRLKSADVQAVTVASDRDASDGRVPTGRLRIRRKFRLPLRVAGRRPLHDLDRVAEELRAVLRV